MPVSLGEWRVRIGTFMRRRRKQYDYNYFWRKLHNLMKKTKNAEQPKENNSPECNISFRNGSTLDASSSSGNTAGRPASSYNVNLNTAKKGPSCDVNNSRGNAKSPTRSQCDGPECDTVEESGSPCDVNSSGHNNVSQTESSCAENSGSSIEKETNPVPNTTDVQIPVPHPYVEDELDIRHITINPMTHEYSPYSTEISKTDRPEVCTSKSFSHVPVDVSGEIDRFNQDKEETSDSGPSGIEDRSLETRQDTTRNTEQTPSSIKEVTEYHGSLSYPILRSGTTSDEADAIKENDCPGMTNILLMRSGDVEVNPGPNDKPGSLTDLELYLLADNMDPSDFRKVGLALGFTEAELSRFEKDRLGNSMQATYQMLYEWRKRVLDSEARETLVVTLQRIKLVQLADSVRKGQVGDHIPSMTEEEIQRVAEEVKHYLAIYLCQIQADPLNSELLLEFERIFTNLTLMEEDKGTKLKTPLLYDDLLRTKVNGTYPKRLLVEGEGGVGKTTFCAKIAWDWIHGKGYQDFKLVLVILLRKAKDRTVGEIVKSYLPDDNPVTAKQLDKHILSNPKDVFLVLDGLDEYAVGLDSNQQIALITLNHLFKSGTVLITSRKWRSDEIRTNADLRKVFAFIAIEGFSPENLSSYITKFFHPDTDSSEDLNRFISNNDVIRENMAPYPIYTAMLCIMWKEFDGDRREAMSKLQTFSQLFNQMIDFLVDHYLSKRIPSGIVEGKLRENLVQIGHIAFNGLFERRLEFTEEEFQSYLESIDVGCKVGVLTREKKVLPRRDRRNNPNSGVTVQFPHKLFQEYLSGMYLASLYKSNCKEYDRLIANIIKEAGEYRYLLYFTSAQQKEVGLNIVSRLIASKKAWFSKCRIDDNFIVDVAYESQDQAVAKAVADHLSSYSSQPLNITEEMHAHTVSGQSFIMNHREVHHLNIGKSCGRTASEDLAEFICSSRSLRSVHINSTMHDVFYSVLANKAVDSKIETLDIHAGDVSERPSASRDLAQFICKMTGLKALTLYAQYHDDFYSTSSSMASSAKVETLKIIHSGLSERPCASRDLAQFICKMPRLKDLRLCGQYHEDFYSTSLSVASSVKIETLRIYARNVRECPSASRDLAQFICKMTHLKNLTLSGQYHDDFYSTSSAMASSAKVKTLNIEDLVLSEHPCASRDLAQFICKMTHLKALTLYGQYHDDFYSTLSSVASSTKIETLDIPSLDVKVRPSASRDLAQFICKMTHLKTLKLGNRYHDDFYSTSSSMASSAKIETLDINRLDLSERPSASRDLAQFICKMTHLKDLTLGGQYHVEFYSTSSSMASSVKIENLKIPDLNLNKSPSASRDLAQFICKMTRLKALQLFGQYHDDFYSTSSSMASSTKIEVLNIPASDLSERPCASRGLAQFICKMTHLKTLKLRDQYHDDFYSTSSSMASSAKIEDLQIEYMDLSERPTASRDLAQFICKMTNLKHLTTYGQYHDDFYSTSSSMASSAKIETINIHYYGLSERPSASRDLAQFICKMTNLKYLILAGQFHDDFYSTSSSMASSVKIETLNILLLDLNERPSASRDFAQFICKMPRLKNLILSGLNRIVLHDDFYSTSLLMASSVKIETLRIDISSISERPSASRDLAQFICKMTHLKDLLLSGQYHDDFYSTSSSMASSTKIETLNKLSEDISERRFASRDFAQFICKMPHLKNLALSGQYHDDFYSTASSMASSAKSCNMSPALTELTVDDETLRGWQDCGSMFNSVQRVTIQGKSTINCDVIQRIHLPGATELTIQTQEEVRQPAGFSSLPDVLLNISPKLAKATFSDLDIGNSKMELMLQALRSSHNLKHLKIIRFIRCGSDECMDDVIMACNKDQVVKVEVEHGEPRGIFFGYPSW